MNENEPIVGHPYKSYPRATRRFPIVEHPTKLPDHTSKLCPHCLKEEGLTVSRTRTYHLIGPMRLEDCDISLPVHEPRVSNHVIWKVLCLAWLVTPSPNSPWYENRCFATCHRRHGLERVSELEYRRQFGRIRWFHIWFKKATRTIEQIIPSPH